MFIDLAFRTITQLEKKNYIEILIKLTNNSNPIIIAGDIQINQCMYKKYIVVIATPNVDPILTRFGAIKTYNGWNKKI